MDTKLMIESVPDQERTVELIGKLFDVARPGAVFSDPVMKDDYTVITASELSVGMGAGFGGGGGSGSGPSEDGEPAGEGEGVGGGGGGGGGTAARPVAAIIIGPNGVRVEPIVDVTKIALAFFTMFGAMMMTLAKMRKFQRTNQLD